MEAITPDPGFVRKLKEIDKNLDVVFSKSLECFCIYYKAPDGRTYKVLEHLDKDGNFLRLDDRLINKLRSWDQSKDPRSAKQIAKASYDQYMKNKDNIRRKRQEETRYKAKQLTPLWSKLADELLENKLYTDGSVKQSIMANKMALDKQAKTNEALIRKFGMPKI